MEKEAQDYKVVADFVHEILSCEAGIIHEVK
jgi:hypothetical protein